MARLLLVASLVGAGGAAGLGAAHTDSSMMQFGAAVDKSNASLTCRPGSPSTCAVSEYVLSGTFSAGRLARVDYGHEVRRSTDTNSCPDGWKIWSARNREDLETVINTVNPAPAGEWYCDQHQYCSCKTHLGLQPGCLGFPFFIVDVTKPSDGCGVGCTGVAMNSDTASVWVTADGSPWYLRGTPASDPSGDYTANCYLGVFKFSDADDVIVNDAGCAHRSSVYLCQPEATATPSPTLAPTVAPSPAPTPSPTPAAITTAPFSIGSTDACSVSSDNVISLNNGGCSIDKQITWDFTDQLVIEFKTRGCKEQDCSTPNVKGPVEPHWFFEPFRSSYAGTGREVPDLWWISRPSDYGFGAYGGWSVSGGSGDGRSPNTNEPSDPIQWHTWAMTFTTAGNCVNLVSWLVDGVSNGFGSDVGNPVTRCSAYGTTTWLGWASYGTTTYTYVKDLSINGAGHISAPAQATPPPAGGAGSGASAVGDPHLQNVRGDRFDLMKAGKHVLINIPRGMSADNALLRVQADARRLGGYCADMYFQELNVTGSWADAKQFGGYHYSVSQREAKTPEWVAFGKVELKVVHGRTDSGLLYLNMYVKHLGRAGFAVGGLLGEDEHADVSVPLEACVQRLSLVAGTHSAGGPVVASVALASFD